VALVILCARPAVAHAQSRPEASRAAGRTLVVTIAAPDEPAAGLVEVLVELCARAGVAVEIARARRIEPSEVVTPRSEPAQILGRVWIELGSAEARLYLVDRGWERVLVRRVARAGRSDEVVREELAHIVQAAAESLLAGAPVGAPREEVRAELALPPARPAPARPPVAPAPTPDAPASPEGMLPSFALGAFYELEGFASEISVVHGPGASVALEASGWPLRPSLELGIGWRVPASATAATAGVDLQGGALRLGASLELVRGELAALRAIVGAGFDLIDVEPTSGDAGGAALTERRLRIAPILRGGAVGRLRLLSGVALELGIAADVDPVSARYVVVGPDGSERVVLEPFVVRPAALLGVTGRLAGTGIVPGD
jgi:hypothetical protein